MIICITRANDHSAMRIWFEFLNRRGVACSRFERKNSKFDLKITV